MSTKTIKYIGFGLIFFVSILFISLFQFRTELNTLIKTEEIKKIVLYPSTIEDRFYDFRRSFTMHNEKQENKVILAAIDEKAIKQFGRYPWTRTTYVPIVNKLKNFGAKVIAFDVVFSEKESDEKDQALAQAFKDFKIDQNHDIVLAFGQTDPYAEKLPDDLWGFSINANKSTQMLELHGVGATTFPINEFMAAGVSVGHISAVPDVDGVFRMYGVVSNVAGTSDLDNNLNIPSLGLMSYQIYSGDKLSLNILPGADAFLTTKKGDLYLNHAGRAKVHWKPIKNFPVVGLADLVNAKDDDEKMHNIFKDTVVYIGSTAFGAHDLRHTPVEPNTPGVYMHMNMTSMLINGHYWKPYLDSMIFSWIILILTTLIITSVALLHNANLDLAVIIALTVGVFCFDTYYLIPRDYELPLFFALLPMILSYMWLTFINFHEASKDKKFLKEAFGTYISPELIDEMYKNGSKPQLGGKQEVLTAYFTDIQGFSTFSEKLTASKLVELLNEYLTEMTDILLYEKGTLDKYEGDAIIAFFGAPMRFEDHATKAVRVSIRMQEALLRLREKWISEGDKWPKIVHEMRMRIGINSGEMVTGNMGSKMRMNYTMMGDSVNLAARLEESAKQYGVFTQISHFTKDLLTDEFVLRQLDTILVVGKSEPVTTFEVLGIKGEAPQLLVDLKNEFEKGIVLYKTQKWDEAIAQFKVSLELEWKRFPELKGKKPNPSEVFIKRCELFKENPPTANWDGVFSLTEK